MTDLPAPPVPDTADLRDFQFYPMDIVRLFGSAFHARTTDAEWRAGITLWLKSYHQVPAGSLPDDDVGLCRAAEMGRDLKAWAKVRAGALRGWTKASDGRLYHETVTEKVIEALQRKEAYRDRSKKANAKRWNGVDHAPQSQGGQGGGKEPEATAKSLTQGIQQGSNKDPIRSASAVLEPPKGQGQGQGQGQDTPAAAAAVVAPTPAGSDGARHKIQGVDPKRIQRAVANADALGVIAAFGGTRDDERDAEWARDAAGMLIAELVAVFWLAQHDRRAIRQPSGLRKEREDWDRNPIEDKRDTVRLAFEQLGIPIPPPRRPSGPSAEDQA